MPVYFVEINLSQGQQANLLTVVSVPGPMFLDRIGDLPVFTFLLSDRQFISRE